MCLKQRDSGGLAATLNPKVVGSSPTGGIEKQLQTRDGRAVLELQTSPPDQGLRAAIARVLGCGWQRCTVHFLRDMLGHCSRQIQPMVATAIRQIFRAETTSQAREHLDQVVDRLATPAPKVARLLDDAAEELLAHYQFPADHWPKLRSTNPPG